MLKGYSSLLYLALSVLMLSACQPSGESASTQEGSGVTPASTKIYQWKMVTTWPPNFPVFQEGVEKFSSDINEMSKGRLKIQVFAAGELVPALQTFEAVSQGSVEMGHGAAYYWAGKAPAAQFMTTVPFGMTIEGVNAWLYGGGGLEIWRELYEPFNLTPFPMGNTAVQMGGWFNKKIESVEDLKGLKMRIPGLGGKVLAKAGGTPVLMAGGELYTALERGTIDAVEWVGPYHDEILGIYRAAKYYYYPGWHEPGAALELLVNRQAWESLPPYLQRIVEIASEAAGVWIHTHMEARNLQSLQRLKEKYHVEILPFSPEVLKTLHQLTQEVLEEEAAKDEVFRKVYKAYQEFRTNNDAWRTIAAGAYQKALDLVAEPHQTGDGTR